jgi:hypothetical protein
MRIFSRIAFFMSILINSSSSIAEGRLSETYENGGGRGEWVRMFSCDFGDVMGMGHHIEMITFVEDNKVLFGGDNPQWIKYQKDEGSYSWVGCYYHPMMNRRCEPDSYEFIMNDEKRLFSLYVRKNNSSRIDKYACTDMSYRK